MTTFTSEDRIKAQAIPEPTWEERWGKKWVDGVRKGWNNQIDIVWFWPLTEQTELDLDYGPTHNYYRAAGIAGVYSIPIQGSIHEYSDVTTTWATNIAPTLSINPTNSVGQLSIGGINIGLEKKPNLFQRVLHKLIGFNWKDSNGN
jgi:hypothetical protein